MKIVKIVAPKVVVASRGHFTKGGRLRQVSTVGFDWENFWCFG